MNSIITFEQAWNYGGPLMWVLAFFSVMELTMILYLWLAQRRGAVLKDGIARLKASNDPAAEGARIAAALTSSVDWLADIAAIAPLVGLLGTVLGMFQAFGGIAADVTAGAKRSCSRRASRRPSSPLFSASWSPSPRSSSTPFSAAAPSAASPNSRRGPMKFSGERKSRAPTLALTSMLDVIFLLLCFFVTSSVFSQWESEITIQLPSAKSSEEPDRLPGEIIANIARDGTVRVNGTEISLTELGAKLAKIAKFYPGQAVIIRADKETSYESLVEVIDVCRGAGVWNFSLATANEM